MDPILVLQNSNESITAILAGAITTTNPIYSVMWTGDGGPANPVGALTGATAKTLLTGNSPRYVESLQIYNADSANITVILAKVVNGTSYNLLQRVLAAGDTLVWSQKEGATVILASGPPAEVNSVPVNGTEGQILTKGAGTTYSWEDAAGGGSLTPWTENIDGGNFNLLNVTSIVSPDSGTITIEGKDGTFAGNVVLQGGSGVVNGKVTILSPNGNPVMSINNSGLGFFASNGLATQQAFQSEPTAETIRDVLIAFGLMAAS